MPEEVSVERILVVVAHPDDCDFGCAGSTARWTSEGRVVSYCIVTDGDAGGSDRTVTRAEVAQLRRREQTAAAAAVGVTDIAFLGHPDGRVQPSIELRRDISRVIRQRRPQRVVTQSPERNYQRIFASHPDHLAAGEAALCAVYPDSRNPFAHMELLEQEGLEPHTVDEVYLMAMAQGDTVVDITDTIDRKLEALKCHASQYDNWEELAERIREWARLNAERTGSPRGTARRASFAFPLVDRTGVRDRGQCVHAHTRHPCRRRRDPRHRRSFSPRSPSSSGRRAGAPSGARPSPPSGRRWRFDPR